MAPSYRHIDYRLRPSKHVERSMLCEAFRRLPFHLPEDYQYVGLGSVFFADFKIMHRGLGISQMISIEKQVRDQHRFTWNKPYSGITMMFGETEQRLAEVDFSRPTIIWLDYDGPLNRSVISDVRHVAHAASHGSALVVTVNSHPRQPTSDGANMLEQVQAELGNERIPAKVDLSSLRGWGLSDFYRSVFDSEVRDALSTANGVKTAKKRLDYEQLFYFQYDDGAKMASFGGVFFEGQKRESFDASEFGRLMYIRTGSEAFRIEAPKLTLREIAHLERQLPQPEDAEIDFGPMPSKDAKQYIKLYRYLPTFMAVDII